MFLTPFYLRALSSAATPLVTHTFTPDVTVGTQIGFANPEPVMLPRELLNFTNDSYMLGYRNTVNVAFAAANSKVIPVFSRAYSASSVYVLGDRVIYSTALYVCTTACGPEAWTAAHWALVNAAGVLATLEGVLNAAGGVGTFLEYSVDGVNWVACTLSSAVMKDKIDGVNQAVQVQLSLTNRALVASAL